MIDKRKTDKPVELKEAMEAVKNAAANGAVNLADLMKNCGGEDCFAMPRMTRKSRLPIR